MFLDGFLEGYSENPNKQLLTTLVSGLSVVGLTAITPPTLMWIWLYVAVGSGIIAVCIFGVIVYRTRKWRREDRGE